MNGFKFTKSEKTHVVVAIKNAALCQGPGGKKLQASVAYAAIMSSTPIPAPLIISRCVFDGNFQASVVSV